MAFVVTEGSLAQLSAATAPLIRSSVRIADDYTADYAEIWRTQASVRMCASFLGRNIASLGIHVFERVSDTDRQRVTDHPAALLLEHPNPRTTRYALINALVQDLAVYDAAYWLKMRDADKVACLWRIPPRMVTPIGGSWLAPERFRVRGSRGYRDYDADQVAHFHGFNPVDPRIGSSPIESLRTVLAEEWEAARMREASLRNGARVSGYLSRPAGAPDWRKSGGFERFRESWRSQYTGGGPQVGGTPILEDGMTFVPAAQTPQQMQYVQVRKLSREECAAAYFIPPPMVGILENATFSNIAEQHKMLYQDTLGPWLEQITQEIELQVLPDLDGPRVYVEFNLAEKLRGSFEAQAAAASTATGAPWMTRNEQRARFNMPALDGADELVTPLNVLIGGQASPRDSAPIPEGA